MGATALLVADVDVTLMVVVFRTMYRDMGKAAHCHITIPLAPLSMVCFFGPMPPHVLCGLRGPHSWAWQECNLLLRLGRPWGAVTLSWWCVSGDRGGRSARSSLKPKFYWSTQTMVTAGIFPFKENSHGRAGNRTWDLMISSQRLWPLDHEAGPMKFILSVNNYKHGNDVNLSCYNQKVNLYRT